MGLGVFGAVGGYGSQHVLVPGTTGLRTVGTKGPFEALGHMACMGFSTLEVLCTFTMPYYSILAYAILFHATPYYSINRDSRVPGVAHPWSSIFQI